MHPKFPIGVTLAAVVLLASACGGGSGDDRSTANLDRSRTEGFLAQDIEAKLDVLVRVACPRTLPKREGARFSCLAFAPLSVPVPVRAKVRDAKGTFTWSMDAQGTAGIETQVQKGIRAQKRVAVTVVCPRLVELDTGAKFTCTAVRPTGARSDVVVTQVDAEGNVTWSA